MKSYISNMLDSTSNAVDKICRLFLMLVMAIMVSVIILQVFCRYILNAALPWPEELTIFLMAWMTFIGASIALKSWEHIGITLFSNMLPKKQRIILSILVKFAVLFFAIFLTYTGMLLVQNSVNTVSEALRISMIWPRLSIPVGGVIMILHSVDLISQEICRLTDKSEVN